jgi:hypothetical protein
LRSSRIAKNVNVVGCTMFVFAEKHRQLMHVLRTWNKDSFVNVHQNVIDDKGSLSNSATKKKILDMGFISA